jgi:hypothetical protein
MNRALLKSSVRSDNAGLEWSRRGSHTSKMDCIMGFTIVGWSHTVNNRSYSVS